MINLLRARHNDINKESLISKSSDPHIAPNTLNTRKIDSLKKKIGFLATIVFGTVFLIYSTLQRSPQPNRKMELLNDLNMIAIGDIHGDLEGLQVILQQAKLIDEMGKWIGGTKVAIQVGDITDRGNQTEETWSYLRDIQAQAKNNGGNFIRLVGNHEFLWLAKDFRYKNNADTHEKCEKVSGWIREDIINRDVKGAYVVDNVMFIHAGITNDMAEILKKEIERESKLYKKVSTSDIADKINRIVFDATKSGNFEHPIFAAGPARGGGEVLPGTFWADKKELDVNPAENMVQVVGHNPGKEIVSKNGILYIDTGISGAYKGHRCYLEFDKRNILSHCKEKTGWETHSLH